MMQDAASLDNLRDIAEPTAVSWWPLAAGWWVMFAAAAIVLSILGYRAWRRWSLNAYRRAALAELFSANSDADVAEILKRTALCAYPRDAVASLTGSSWCDWLSRTVGAAVPPAVAQRLAAGVFQNPGACSDDLREFAVQWISSHTIQDDESDRQQQTQDRSKESC